jgi:hypothetical protein
VSFLSGFNNDNIFDNCHSLENLTVTVEVTEDLVTAANNGFSLQLNCYPQSNQIPQGQSLTTSQVGDLELTWLQYLIIVQNGYAFEIQYWSTNAHGYASGQPWPPTYTPNPPGTTPWLPVFPNTADFSGFGSSSSSELAAGSTMVIALTTDPTTAKVTSAQFSVTDPDGNVSSAPPQNFTADQQFTIYGFQVDLVSPPSSATTFTSGAGTISATVSSGTLEVQTGATTCSSTQPGTGENSNAIYSAPVPSVGSTLTQTLSVAPMGMAFNFDKSTFSQDEVAQSATWGSAYWLSVSGFPNSALGFNSPSDLSSQPALIPTVTAAIDASLNPGLSAAQLATIAANLPVVDQFGPAPVLATDDTLAMNYQTFMYPYTISFPNRHAFEALDAHQVAIITLTATLTVPVPSGTDSHGNTTFTNIPMTCHATIELAKGEDPFFFNLNPTDPESYPTWLSFDLRIFSVTANQSHKMFSVPNPATAGDAITYIQKVLHHLNHPALITNGDTFESALTQTEDQSAVALFPTIDGEPVLSFAVARLRLRSNIVTTIEPVRIFFRLFNAASTVSDFAEVGMGFGTYRWGTNGTPGHKIPLLGVQPGGIFLPDYVTVPCFATERVNLGHPADMTTQTDPTNARSITTVAGSEVDTYFGCWLDVNQTTPFLVPTPSLLETQWDGPWTPTESLNGVVTTAPHQCLVAEIRYDDVPIPTGATTATSDKLAQRNIAWLA